MRFLTKTKLHGFTLVELMVVVSIIGLLSSAVYANFSSARANARDDVRKTDLKNLQLAIEQYKAQNGKYPASCTGNPYGVTEPYWGGSDTYSPSATWLKSCPTDYIVGLTPDFIAVLPEEPGKKNTGRGYVYATNANRTAYKLLSHHNVEQKIITDFTDNFARFPSAAACSFASPIFPSSHSRIYAVYSAGAECW